MNSKSTLKTLLFAICLATLPLISHANGSSYWLQSTGENFNKSNERKVYPEKYLPLELNLAALRNYLATAPKEFSVSWNQGLIIDLPMPDGNFKRYSILETQMMEPGLSAKYPQLKTYVGKGVDDVYARLRLDMTELGFHAMIATPNGYVFIDPVNNTELQNYLCYYRADMPNACNRHCEFGGDKVQDEERLAKELSTESISKILKIHDSGDELRTYRLALACTGEYAATKGGTVIGALSGMVTTVNRVNGVYETEVAVRMVLIANTDTLIFLSASSDPYSNFNGGAMLTQNQNTVTARIGNSNYDFGHVFSTGGGGIAGLGVICNNSQKANGVTGLPNPVGDAFDIDYVAHEMGHQFGANHTFNNDTDGSCQGNASQGHNFEPGSGSTIMAYAGLCSPFDLQQHSDPIFHTGSYDEIFNYSIFGFGNSCASISFTNNSVPVINTLNDYIIPFRTPFTLVGSASDGDGDPMTYIWEEYDSGPFGNPSTPTGDAAIIRDFTPSTDSTRTIPRLVNLVNNTSVLGERLPTYARTLHFKFTARDNRTAGGGVANNFTPVAIQVINTTNPFKVNVPNVNTVQWHYGATELVTWDVSSTDLAPINCANVNIRLSMDGGFTYPYLLLANTPNDGSEMVYVPDNGTIPMVNSSQARIKVEAAGNIFFDISNANFSLLIPTGISKATNGINLSLFPNPVSNEVKLSLSDDYNGSLTVSILDYLGRIISQKTFVKNATGFTANLDMAQLAKGTYTVEVQSTAGKVSKRLVKI